MDIHPNALNAYSTYPHKSENYYGFPQFPDVLVNYARKDIICHEAEQKNFMAKYNQKLPCTGEELDAMTWDDFKNVGEFFRRKKGEMLAGKPAEDDFYGIAFQAGKSYDFSSMQINGFIWQMGGDIWDETQAPNRQSGRRRELAGGREGTGEVSEPDRSTCRRSPRRARWTSSSRTSCSAKARWP